MELTPFLPFKLLRHGPVVARMLAGQRVYPISVEFDLSLTCNHGCAWCSFNGFRQENWVHFPGPRALLLLEELAAVGVKSITFTGGGEPLVHKSATELFVKAHSLGLQYGVVTNGRLLQGAVRDEVARTATFLRVSLDAGTTQTHQLLHATAKPEFETILTNLATTRALATSRASGPTLGASFCVFDVNVDEIEVAAKQVKRCGANYLEVRPVFATEWRGGGFSGVLSDKNVERAQWYISEAKRRYDDDTFQVIGMAQRFDQLEGKDKTFERCHIGPLTTVISSDGYIYHCCQQRGMPNFRAGSVLERSFEDVWLDATHQKMIDGIDVAKCPPCRYAGYNQLIEQAFQQDALHGNFL